MTGLTEAEAASGGDILSEGIVQDVLGGRTDTLGLWNILTPLQGHGKPSVVNTTGEITACVRR